MVFLFLLQPVLLFFLFFVRHRTNKHYLLFRFFATKNTLLAPWISGLSFFDFCLQFLLVLLYTCHIFPARERDPAPHQFLPTRNSSLTTRSKPKMSSKNVCPTSPPTNGLSKSPPPFLIPPPSNAHKPLFSQFLISNPSLKPQQ